MVWPVGAVSKRTWSYRDVRSSFVSRPVNSLNEAISVVQDPESDSVTERNSSSGIIPRSGPTIRSRYCSTASSGSISSATSPGTSVIGVMRLPTVWPKTWPMFEAGSVLTSNTVLPASTNSSAVAQAIDVLPTPPLPVKKK